MNGIARCGDESLKLNVFFNSQVDIKKLTFHTATSSGPSKCVRMHIGRQSSTCPQLKVHDQIMLDVSSVSYLGDLVSSDGSNSKNIQNRCRKGIGLVCQIMKIVYTMNLGPFMIETALLLRESILINGMLTNAEIWYGLKLSEIENLEKVDRSFLSKILGLPQTTPVPALYLETGTIPIGIIIKQRRLNYLNTILRSSKEGMLWKVFTVQWYYPCEGDWTLQIKRDLEEFELPSDLTKLEEYSKEGLKNLIKAKARKHAFKFLGDSKGKYSKLSNIQYEELKIQDYLLNPKFSSDEKRIITLLRTRMAKFGENYKAGKTLTICPLCNSHVDSQTMLLKCPKIIAETEKKFGVNHQNYIDELYSEDISETTVKIIKNAMEYRIKQLKD